MDTKRTHFIMCVWCTYNTYIHYTIHNNLRNVPPSADNPSINRYLLWYIYRQATGTYPILVQQQVFRIRYKRKEQRLRRRGVRRIYGVGEPFETYNNNNIVDRTCKTNTLQKPINNNNDIAAILRSETLSGSCCVL